jgi:tRNA A-37 threonylcarbamoyl transferase component Bud32
MPGGVSEAALAALEAEVRENRRPKEDQMAAVTAFAISPDDPAYPRYLTLRAIVENRLGLFQTAMVSLAEAREIARRAGNKEQLGAIAVAAVVVNSWRSDTRAAALDLVEAFALGAASGSRPVTDAALAEAARLGLESGRYEVGLRLIDLLTAMPDTTLSAYERARVEINRCQLLNALDRPDEALAAVARAAPSVPAEPPRLRFLLKLEEAWALAGLGRNDEAEAISGELSRNPLVEPSHFEWAEHALLAGTLLIDRDPAAATSLLREVAARFAADDLPRHEIDAGIGLAEALHALGREEEAQDVLLAALRRAVTRQLPAMADRVRKHIAGLLPANEMLKLIRDAGDKNAERFLVVKAAGAGGTAQVYRAFDLDTGEEVALKRYRFDAAVADRPAVLESLRREIIIGDRVRVSGIIRIRYLNIGAEDDLVLVEDFVRGRSLREVLGDAASRRQLLDLLADVMVIVAGLHRAQLVHRDLKPENVLVKDDAPIVMDFGIASLKGVIEAMPGMGTRDYIAPEVIDPSLRSTDAPLGAEDVFALGRMASEIWTLVAPPAPQRGWLGRAKDPNEDVVALMRAMTEHRPDRRPNDLFAAAEMFRAAARRLVRQDS